MRKFGEGRPKGLKAVTVWVAQFAVFVFNSHTHRVCVVYFLQHSSTFLFIYYFALHALLVNLAARDLFALAQR